MNTTERRIAGRPLPPTPQTEKADSVWSGEQYAAERRELLDTYLRLSKLIAAYFGNIDLRHEINRQVTELKDLLQDEGEMRERFVNSRKDLDGLCQLFPEVFNDPQPVN